MAKILNNFFSSVFTNEHLLNAPSMGLKCLGEPFPMMYLFICGVCLEVAM